MKRIEFIRLVSLSGLTLLAVPSCTDLELESSEQRLTDGADTVGEEGSQLMNSFNSAVGNRVPLADAKTWTAQFNSENAGENYFHISRAELSQLIESTDCNGIMFQLAENNENQIELVLGEMNKNGQVLDKDQFAITGTRDINSL